MKYSFIIPVYNRPDEVDELLDTILRLPERDFEVIIVEDGSAVPCKKVVDKYSLALPVHYFTKPNSGPGQTRNFGAEQAQGDWLLILDSDVLLPETYLSAIDVFLQTHAVDAFGGPDRAHTSFTPMQKAINYAMTSFFTTGGIRGGKKKLDKFYPRSYNMGIRREVYLALGGFRDMRFGEDIDFSYRLVENNHPTALVPDAYVYHKRRTDLRKFFRQVYNSGIARVNLSILHPGTLKPVHLLPSAFTLGTVFLLLAGFYCSWAWALLGLYIFMVFADSTMKNHSFRIGLLSVAAAFVQLFGYGLGFLSAAWRRWVLRKDNKNAFENTFYK